MSVVSRKTSSGIPILYMPRKWYQFDSDDLDKTKTSSNGIIEIEKLFSRIRIYYDLDKTMEVMPKQSINLFDKNTVFVTIYFFDKICSFLNMCEIVNLIKINSYNNMFILIDLLKYAFYKLDIDLINLILKKLYKQYITSIYVYIIPEIKKLSKQNLLSKQLYIKMPEYLTEQLLQTYMYQQIYTNDIYTSNEYIDENTFDYIIKCTETLTLETTIDIIVHDKLEMLIKCHDKIKLNLLPYALRYESLRITEYLYSFVKPIKEYINIDFLNEVGINADLIKFPEQLIEEGNLDLIKQLYINTTDVNYLNERMLIYKAVLKNDYEMIEFLVSKGVEIDLMSSIHVAYIGSINILDLFVKNGIKVEDTFVYYAAYNGQIEFLKHLYNNGHKFKYELINYMVSGNYFNINCIESLESLEYIQPFKDHILTYACKEENIELEIIEYLYNKGCKVDSNIMTNLSHSGSIDVFKFFMSKGMVINQHTIGNLATRGQFSIIRNLYNNIVPVISFSTEINGQLIVRFFDKNKKELDYITVLKGINYGCFEIKQSFVVSGNNKLLADNYGINTINPMNTINCIIYNQLPPLDEGTIQTTARHRHVELLKFLIHKKAPIDNDAMYDAIIRGFTDVVIMLYEYMISLNIFINIHHVRLAKLWNRHEILAFFKDKHTIECTDKLGSEYIINDFNYYSYSIQQILYQACSHGELDIIKTYRGSMNIKIKPVLLIWSQSGYKHEHENMFYVAILNGQFNVLRYLEPYFDKTESKYTACASRIGRIDVLVYLIENNYSICEKAIENATEKGRLDIIKYLLKTNAPISENALKIAKKYNFNEIYEEIKNKQG